MSSALGDEVIDNGLGTTINTEHSPKSIRELSHTVKNHLGEQKLIIKSEKDAGLHNKEVSFDNDDSHPQVTKEAALGHTSYSEEKDSSKISAYARLDFDNYTFFVQTLQVILGRKSNDELINGSQHSVDVHLSSKKAISRRHAKIFYNFGTQRFELSILGRNGAFVDDLFIEKGMTIPLVDGTKIQIGDITFLFILPSIETDDIKDSSAAVKPFNPSDAISLRSSLYSNSNSPSKLGKVIPESESRKSIRRGSRNIPRKLSEARRKSLASATNEEISTILNELGVKTLDDIKDIDEQDPEYVDAQIRAILGDGAINGESAIADDDDGDDFLDSKEMINDDLAVFNEAEEDEIDQLVKQHNLEQGVNLDESALGNDEIDMGVIDDEIANLAPLIAHNQGKDKSNIYANSQYSGNRTAPLMGKPAAPRMGKPASIQPPSSRLYGRSVLAIGIAKNQVIDTRLQSMNSPMSGIPAHLVSKGTNDYSLKVSQGNLGVYNQQLVANQFSGYNKPYAPNRPPVPELLVPIHTIEQKPTPQPEVIVDKITVITDYLYPPIFIPKIIGKPGTIPKIPKRRMESLPSKKPVKSIYSMNEIPEHYRTKPTLSFPAMIINVLKYKNDPNGLTFNEINEGIKEIYPYYKYCPDGWQSVVIHNVRLNKLFKRLETNKEEEEEYEQRWLIDEAFVQEKEKVRKKQQEIATQRAKEAAIKAEDLKQKQRLEMQQSISQNIVGRDFNSPYSLPLSQHAHLLNQSQLLAQLHQKNTSLYQTTPGVNVQKPKTIAEIASEIRRDGQSSKTPMYFKPLPSSDKAPGSSGESPSTIKAQLAANRSQYSQSPAGGSSESSPTRAQSPSINQDTKKSLTYLQKELFTLYKARKLSYNTTTTTEIITKALATTIAQVNAIGSKAGVGDNALSFLVERAPQQVSKILDIALTKSIKEKQGIISSKPNSRGTTPGPSQISSPQKTVNSPAKTEAEYSSIVNEANKIGSERLEQKLKQQSPILVDDKPDDNEKDKAETISSLGKPPLFKASKSESPITRPLSNPTNTLSRPQSFGKPTALAKPPFVSNKPPTRPGYGSKPERKDDDDDKKRTLDTNDEGSSKMARLH